MYCGEMWCNVRCNVMWCTGACPILRCRFVQCSECMQSAVRCDAILSWNEDFVQTAHVLCSASCVHCKLDFINIDAEFQLCKTEQSSALCSAGYPKITMHCGMQPVEGWGCQAGWGHAGKEDFTLLVSEWQSWWGVIAVEMEVMLMRLRMTRNLEPPLKV